MPGADAGGAGSGARAGPGWLVFSGGRFEVEDFSFPPAPYPAVVSCHDYCALELFEGFF